MSLDFFYFLFLPTSLFLFSITITLSPLSGSVVILGGDTWAVELAVVVLVSGTFFSVLVSLGFLSDASLISIS